MMDGTILAFWPSSFSLYMYIILKYFFIYSPYPSSYSQVSFLVFVLASIYLILFFPALSHHPSSFHFALAHYLSFFACVLVHVWW